MARDFPNHYLQDLIQLGRLEEVRKHANAAYEPYLDSPFSEIQTSKFQNSVEQIANELKAFIENESRKMTIRLIYTEMNAFAWNTDHWHYHWVAYELPADHPDLDSGGWQSDDNICRPLRGMESLQRVFASDQGEPAADACVPLVILQFMDLMLRAVESFDDLPAPVVVSAHESGYRLEIRRIGGETYLGRQHRHLDTFDPIPTRLEQSMQDPSIAAYRNSAFYNRSQWLHRIGVQHQSGVKFDPPRSSPISVAGTGRSEMYCDPSAPLPSRDERRRLARFPRRERATDCRVETSAQFPHQSARRRAGISHVASRLYRRQRHPRCRVSPVAVAGPPGRGRFGTVRAPEEPRRRTAAVEIGGVASIGQFTIVAIYSARRIPQESTRPANWSQIWQNKTLPDSTSSP